jgi:hypothetical protein
VRVSGFDERLSRVTIANSQDTANMALFSESESTYTFLPVYLQWAPWHRKALAGKLRQIAMGPYSYRDTFVHDAETDAVVAYGFCPATISGGVDETMWFVNVEV